MCPDLSHLNSKFNAAHHVFIAYFCTYEAFHLSDYKRWIAFRNHNMTVWAHGPQIIYSGLHVPATRYKPPSIRTTLDDKAPRRQPPRRAHFQPRLTRKLAEFRQRIALAPKQHHFQ